MFLFRRIQNIWSKLYYLFYNINQQAPSFLLVCVDFLYSGWRLQRLQDRHHHDSGSRGFNHFNEADLSYGTGAEHF